MQKERLDNQGILPTVQHPGLEYDCISKTTKILVSSFMGGVFICIIYMYFRHISHGGHPWMTADWLINYGSGFVRRGAFGTLAIFISDLLTLDLLWTVAILQSLSLFLVFSLVMVIFLKANRSHVELMILLSPAFLLFPFYDPKGGFRKEILVYIPFLLLVRYLQRGEIPRYSVFLILATYAFALFSHEVAFFVLPFFLLVTFMFFHLKIIGMHQMYILMASFVFLAGIAIICSVIFPGTDKYAAICNHLVSKGLNPEICGGAINSLQYDAFSGMKWVVKFISNNNYLFTYASAMVLSMVPFIFMQPINISRKNIIYFLSLSFIFMLPLYVVAFDWGRWVSIFIFFLSTFVFALTALGYLKPRIKMPVILILPYALLWSIPHYHGEGLNFGIVGLFKRILLRIVTLVN